jgi:hypothetical protein
LSDQPQELVFKKATKVAEYKAIYDHNLDAFTDSPDFNWDIEEIKKEVKEGWNIFSAHVGEDIIAALFLKLEGKKLLTKNTGTKMSHQGSGYSHNIKEFFEKSAKEMKAKKIYHYCRIDNFRMYSLNESHGYAKTAKKLDSGLVVEWEKLL